MSIFVPSSYCCVSRVCELEKKSNLTESLDISLFTTPVCVCVLLKCFNFSSTSLFALNRQRRNSRLSNWITQQRREIQQHTAWTCITTRRKKQQQRMSNDFLMVRRGSSKEWSQELNSQLVKSIFAKQKLLHSIKKWSKEDEKVCHCHLPHLLKVSGEILWSRKMNFHHLFSPEPHHPRWQQTQN